MDPEAIAGLDLLNGDRVVEVPGFFTVYRDRRKRPEVAPSPAHGGSDLLRDVGSLLENGRGELYRQFILFDDELGFYAGLAGFADDPDDPAFRRPAAHGIGDDLR